MTVRILIATEHAVVQQGLRLYLGLDPAVDVVGAVADSAAAVVAARTLRPDVVLLDVATAGAEGLRAISTIRQELPETEVIALTGVLTLDDAAVIGAVRAGVSAFLLQDTRAEDLSQAIQAAAAGQVQLALEAAARLLQALAAPARPQPLTEQETDVLRLLAQGATNAEIAHGLGLTEQAVQRHVTAILKKLGVLGRIQAALYAVQSGLIPQERVGALRMS